MDGPEELAMCGATEMLLSVHMTVAWTMVVQETKWVTGRMGRCKTLPPSLRAWDVGVCQAVGAVTGAVDLVVRGGGPGALKGE